MKRIVLLLLAVLLCMPSFLPAQTISLEEFLDQLKQAHPLFKKERLAAQINKAEQDGYLGDRDWRVFSSLNLMHEEPAMASTGPEKTNAIAFEGGVERLFWRTGGSLSMSFSTSRADIKIDPMYGFPDPFYQNKLEVSYVHPLMKNRNGFLNQLQYNLKKFDIDFSEVQALENQEDFLARSTARFLDLVFLMEQSKIIQERLKLSEEELARTRKKRKANLVNNVDVIRARDAVSIARQNLVLIQSRTKALQAELAVLTHNDEFNKLEPQFDLYVVNGLMPVDEAVSKLKENSRLVNAINIRLEQLGYSKKGFEEALKPELSIVTSLNTKNLDDGIGGSLKMDKPDAFVGLQFSLPLGNNTAKSQIRKTELQREQLKEQLDEVVVTLTSALSGLYI
jgi:hypothetical protein